MQLLLFWTGLIESLIFSPNNRSVLAYKSYHFSELERCVWLHLVPPTSPEFSVLCQVSVPAFCLWFPIGNLRILVTVCKVNITVTFSLPSKHPVWSGQVRGAESKLVLLREIAFSNYCIFYLFCFASFYWAGLEPLSALMDIREDCSCSFTSLGLKESISGVPRDDSDPECWLFVKLGSSPIKSVSTSALPFEGGKVSPKEREHRVV